MIKKAFIILSFVISVKSFALTKFDVNLLTMDTSDSINMFSKEIRFDRYARDLSWPYKIEEPSLFDYGVHVISIHGNDSQTDFDSLHARGYIGKQWSEFAAKIFLGSHNLKSTVEKSLFTYKLQLEKKFSDMAFVELFYDFDWGFKHLILPGATKNFINVKDVGLNATITPHAKLRFPFKLQQSGFSDGNNKNRVDASFLYGSSYPLWIWGGYGFEYLRNSKKSASYWSPDKLVSHRLQFEVAKNLKEVWTLKFSGSYSYLKEEENDWTQSSYLSFGVDYGDRDSLLISAFYNRIKAIQENSTWSMNEIGMNFNYLF